MLAALVATALCPLASALPSPLAARQTTFPSSFKIKEGSGYFEVQNTFDTIHTINAAQASSFYINGTTWDGAPISQLAYTNAGQNYLAWLENGSGIIIFHPTYVHEATQDSPVIASLLPSGQIDLQPFEPHTNFYLQDCGGLIEIASSQGTNCVLVTASIA